MLRLPGREDLGYTACRALWDSLPAPPSFPIRFGALARQKRICFGRGPAWTRDGMIGHAADGHHPRTGGRPMNHLERPVHLSGNGNHDWHNVLRAGPG